MDWVELERTFVESQNGWGWKGPLKATRSASAVLSIPHLDAVLLPSPSLY